MLFPIRYDFLFWLTLLFVVVVDVVVASSSFTSEASSTVTLIESEFNTLSYSCLFTSSTVTSTTTSCTAPLFRKNILFFQQQQQEQEQYQQQYQNVHPVTQLQLRPKEKIMLLKGHYHHPTRKYQTNYYNNHVSRKQYHYKRHSEQIISFACHRNVAILHPTNSIKISQPSLLTFQLLQTQPKHFLSIQYLSNNNNNNNNINNNKSQHPSSLWNQPNKEYYDYYSSNHWYKQLYNEQQPKKPNYLSQRSFGRKTTTKCFAKKENKVLKNDIITTDNFVETPKKTNSSSDKFSLSQRIDSGKCLIVGAIVGSLALAPVAAVHDIFLSTLFSGDGSTTTSTINGLAQFEFDCDIGAIQGGLFAIVYRYCIREDTDNVNLNQGVVGAFVIIRSLSRLVVPSYCTPFVLTCGPPFQYLDWYLLSQLLANGLESIALFGSVAIAIDTATNKGYISRFPG